MLVIPEGAVLVHGRKGDGFPHGAATGGGVTNIGDNQTRLLVDLFEEGRTGGDVGRATNDGVIGVDTEWGKEGVHAAAEALIKAGFAGKNFGHGAVNQEGAGEIFDAAAGEVGFDDFQRWHRYQILS